MTEIPEFDVPDSERDAETKSRGFGIRAKLFTAFCGFAALTIIASLVAWLVFTTIEQSVDEVTQESVPGMVDALALAKKVADIAAAAPKLATSSTQEELAVERAALAQDLEQFADVSASLDKAGFFARAENQTGARVEELSAQLGKLKDSVERRLSLKNRREEITAAMQKAHADFSETLEPLVDDAVFSLVINGEKVMVENSSSTTNLVEDGIANIDRLLSISAAANLAAGLIAEAAAVTDPVQLEPIRERFLSAGFEIDRELARLPDIPRTSELRDASIALLGLGRGKRNIFDQRGTELARKKVEGRGSSELKKDLDQRHNRLLLLLTPMVDDASFDLVLATERVTNSGERAISGLIEGNVNTLSQVLTIRAEGNLAASLLSDAAVLSDEQRFTPLQDRFTAVEARLMTLLEESKGAAYYSNLSSATKALLEHGHGNESIFSLRSSELAEEKFGQSLLEQSRALALQLSDSVARIVSEAPVSQ